MKVQVIEVGPRDGLQNEKNPLSLTEKKNFIKNLIQSGCLRMEIGSFVRPDLVPQMADSAALAQEFSSREGMGFLVPNLKGLELAQKYQVQEIGVLTSPSESFNRRNINSTVSESLENIKKIVTLAPEQKISAHLSMSFGCPYEGKIEEKEVFKLVESLVALKVDEFVIADTIGVATPKKVKSLLQGLKKITNLKKTRLHFHDTWGMALLNVAEGLEQGITSFDSSAAGLGGCPFAKGATGNLATEDLLYFLESMGIFTGVDLSQLTQASQDILKTLGKTSPSRIHHNIKKGLSRL